MGQGGGAEIADGLYSASLPRTALMNPIGKGGGCLGFLVYLLCAYPSPSPPAPRHLGGGGYVSRCHWRETKKGYKIKRKMLKKSNIEER